MDIIAHRGCWNAEKEKNTIEGLLSAFEKGYGIETDIRDYCGKLVISHNIADSSSPAAEEMFRLYRDGNFQSMLALNIKADGIQPLLEPLLQKYNIENYFLFDMSIPELIVNCNRKLCFYTRHSDVEESCVMYQEASGVWLDSFYNERWVTGDIIKKHLSAGKFVSIVSPELHQNAPEQMWNMLKAEGFHNHKQILLCTDMPDQARSFFYGKD